MNVKISKYFLISIILILFFGIFNFYFANRKHLNIYFNRIEEIFNKFNFIEEIFDSELENYFNNNYINKYSIKEIRDEYTNIRTDVLRVIDEITLNYYYKKINKRYLIDILSDVLRVVNNDFLINGIFNSNDEIIIKNIQSIIQEFNRILNKYNIFKFNFGIIDI